MEGHTPVAISAVAVVLVAVKVAVKLAVGSVVAVVAVAVGKVYTPRRFCRIGHDSSPPQLVVHIAKI